MKRKQFVKSLFGLALAPAVSVIASNPSPEEISIEDIMKKHNNRYVAYYHMTDDDKFMDNEKDGFYQEFMMDRNGDLHWCIDSKTWKSALNLSKLKNTDKHHIYERVVSRIKLHYKHECNSLKTN